jgi:hypothetical protein
LREIEGRVVATDAGGWEIHYNVHLADPTTGKAKRHHRSRVVGYKPKMHRADAEKILASELAAINGGPVPRAADGTITVGKWDAEFLHPHARRGRYASHQPRLPHQSRL